MFYVFQLKEAAQRQEEAKYRALGYLKPAEANEDIIKYQGLRPPPKPIEEITCFKCGNKGHYANKCPKGHLAFLSQNQSASAGGGFRR